MKNKQPKKPKMGRPNSEPTKVIAIRVLEEFADRFNERVPKDQRREWLQKAITERT